MTSPNTQSPHFPNGFVSWTETHHVIVEIISRLMDQDEYPEALEKIHYQMGTGGIWELCSDLTFEFENEYVGDTWEDSEWFDTLEDWVLDKVNGD